MKKLIRFSLFLCAAVPIFSYSIDTSQEEILCAEMGFQRRTESFANCVLRLVSKKSPAYENLNRSNRADVNENDAAIQALEQTKRIQSEIEREREYERRRQRRVAEEERKQAELKSLDDSHRDFVRRNERAMCQSRGYRYCN